MIKKIQTISIACITLIAALALIPTVQAGQFHIIKGTLYIDNVLMGEGAQIKVDILTDTFYFDTFDPDINNYTYYLGGFDNDQYYGATAYFTVLYNSLGYTPIDNNSVKLNKNTNPGAENYIFDIHINTSIPANNPPNEPTLIAPYPSGRTVSGTTSTTLRVGVSDPDEDSMDVSFYNANGDVLIGTTIGVSSGGTASYVWTGLSPDTSYSWYAVANDGILETQSATWAFKTAKSGGGGGSSGGGGGGGGGYIAPTADANGPYYEFLDKTLGYAEITFDGSGSTGDITLYSWDFGDGTKGTGLSPTHRYQSVDNYTVTLNTSGPAGFSVDQTFAVITKEPNLPPSDPIVDGPQSGSKNTDYEYTMVSTDGDNDSIEYLIDWDDDTTETTGFYASGTIVIDTHKWSAAGVYTVKVTASDNDTVSGTTNYVVLIDSWWVKNIGYLLDTDGDGTYDSFHSNETGETTDVEKQDDGTYLINSDDDSEWDWIYDKDTDTLTEYVKHKAKDNDNTILYIAAILIVLLLLLLLILAGRKKRKKEEAEKEKKQTNKKKKQTNKKKTK